MDYCLAGVDGLAGGDHGADEWHDVSGSVACGECCWIGDCVVVYFGHATHHPWGADLARSDSWQHAGVVVVDSSVK